MTEGYPTLTDLIQRLEAERQAGVVAIEYRVDELLAILRWNTTAEGQAENRRAISLQMVMEYIEVLAPREREAALCLVLKAAGIRHNAELVETWLASASMHAGEQ